MLLFLIKEVEEEEEEDGRKAAIEEMKPSCTAKLQDLSRSSIIYTEFSFLYRLITTDSQTFIRQTPKKDRNISSSPDLS